MTGSRTELMFGLPVIQNLLQHLNYYATLIHKSMVGTFDKLDGAFVFTHILLHPPYGILRNLLILVAVPHMHLMRIVRVRESPWVIVVIQDLQQIIVHPLRRFGM